jgi:hypothetical protein
VLDAPSGGEKNIFSPGGERKHFSFVKLYNDWHECDREMKRKKLFSYDAIYWREREREVE